MSTIRLVSTDIGGSMACGCNSHCATGNNIVIGALSSTSSNSERNVVLGWLSHAMDSENVVVGSRSRAEGYDGVVIGNRAISNDSGIAIGFGARAYDRGLAIGMNSLAHPQSIAIGHAIASNQGIAIGDGTSANTEESIAIGNGVETPSDRSIEIAAGKYHNSGTGLRITSTHIAFRIGGSWKKVGASTFFTKIGAS